MKATFLADGHLAAICVDMTPRDDSDILNGGLQVQKWLDEIFTLRSWAHIDGVERNDILG